MESVGVNINAVGFVCIRQRWDLCDVIYYAVNTSSMSDGACRVNVTPPRNENQDHSIENLC